MGVWVSVESQQPQHSRPAHPSALPQDGCTPPPGTSGPSMVTKENCAAHKYGNPSQHPRRPRRRGVGVTRTSPKQDWPLRACFSGGALRHTPARSHLRLTPSMYQMPVIKAPQRGRPYSFPLSSLNSLPSVKGRGLAPNSAPFYLPLTTLRPGAGLPAASPEGRCDWFKGLPPELGRRPEQHLPSIHFSSHFHRLQVQWTDGQADEHCPCRGVGEA